MIKVFVLPEPARAALCDLLDIPEGESFGHAIDWDFCNEFCDELLATHPVLLGASATYVTEFLAATVEQCDAARAGRAAGQLGALHYGGRLSEDGEPTYEQAVRWYEKGAELADVQSIINLGYCHQYGRSVPKSPERAFACFQRAAFISNSPEAYYKLGDMYRWGQSVEKNEELAAGLYFKALSALPDDADHECPELAASVAHRVADHLMSKANSASDPLETALSALSLYQAAERNYVRAITSGYGYYQRQYEKVLVAQEDARNLVRRLM